VVGAQSLLTGVVCNELERRIAGIVWPKLVSVCRPSSPANSPPETACLAGSRAIEFFSGGEVYIEADFCRFLRFPAAILLTKFSESFIVPELPTIRELTLVSAHRGSTAALPEASDNPAL
jgi:hypothetical protein